MLIYILLKKVIWLERYNPRLTPRLNILTQELTSPKNPVNGFN